MSEDLLRVTPPSDLVTEQNLLGGVLIQSELFPRVAAVVDGEDYYLEKHRRIFAAMHRLHAEGTEINGRAISDALRIAGDLKSIGGDDYLLLLTADPQLVPTHVVGYGKTVHRLALARDLAAGLADTARHALEGGEVSDYIASAQRVIAKVSARQLRDRPPFGDVLADVYANLENDQAEHIPTGLDEFDTALNGGLRRSELVTVAALTGQGKTTLCLTIAANIARAKGSALFASAEMNERDLAKRLLFAEGRVEHIRLLCGLRQEERARLEQARDQITAGKFQIEYRPGLTPSAARAIAERFKIEWGSLDVLFVDYLNLLKSDRREERREREVASITRELKLLAGELNCELSATLHEIHSSSC